MRGIPVEKQIQWVLLYIQEKSIDIWKENILKDLEREWLEYKTVGEFLANIKKKFREEDKKSIKIAKLKRLE